MDKAEAMGRRPVGRLLADFCLPAIGGMLVSSLYNLVDRIFIGQGTGVAGIAAITAAFPIQTGSMAIGVLFATGTRSLTALAMGRGEVERADEYLSRATGASFALAAALSVVAWIFSDPLLFALGATEATISGAKAYLSWVLLSAAFQAAAVALSSGLTAEGRPKAGFVLTLSGTVINALLAPLFIFVFRWGVGGAGAAVAISQISSFVLSLAAVEGKKSRIKLRRRFILPLGKRLVDVIRIGLPLFLFQMLACVTLAVANLAVKPYKGDTGLAVIGIITTLIQFLGFPLFGIISGAQPLWGYNFGAGKWARIRKISLLTMIWTVAFAVASEAAMLLFPGFFVGLFSTDPALAALGIRSLRIFACAFALFPLELLAVSYFQSTNRAFPAAVAMLIRSLSFIAGMIVFPIFMGYEGVLWAGPVSDVLTAALGAVYSLKMRNEIRRACREEAAGAIA